MKPFGGGNFQNADICLKYVLTHGATITIPGMMSLEEVRQNTAVADRSWELTPEEEAELNRQAEEIGRVFCRRCDYCQPCPQEIRISQVLHSYSMAKRMGQRWLSQDRLEQLAAMVDRCTECRSCVERCPYTLDIPELMKQRIDYLREQLAQWG